jgi:hypothetical protein
MKKRGHFDLYKYQYNTEKSFSSMQAKTNNQSIIFVNKYLPSLCKPNQFKSDTRNFSLITLFPSKIFRI